MNGKVVSLLRELRASWKLLLGIIAIGGFLLSGWTKVQTVAQVPEKIEALKLAHDTQTAILREQLRATTTVVELQRCQIILTAPPELRSLLPAASRQRCLVLSVRGP